MRRRAFVLVALAGGLALTLVAFASCAGEGDEPTPTTPAGTVPPTTPAGESSPGSGPSRGPAITPAPRATLSAGGRSVTVPGGTRCWANACVDYVGPVSNTTPFALGSGALALEFEAGPATDVTVSWYAVGAEPTTATTEGLLWTEPRALGQTPAANSLATRPAAPGRYLLIVFARWAGRGDVSYAFYVEQ